MIAEGEDNDEPGLEGKTKIPDQSFYQTAKREERKITLKTRAVAVEQFATIWKEEGGDRTRRVARIRRKACLVTVISR